MFKAYNIRALLCDVAALCFGAAGVVNIMEGQQEAALISAAVAALWAILAELIEIRAKLC